MNRTLAIFGSLLFPCFLAPVFGVDVGGVLSSSATWDLAGSPYNITSKVQVANGATLTIQPGVIVTNGTIEVFGELRAIGDPAARVQFKSVAIWSGSTGPGQSDFTLRFCHFRRGYVTPNGGITLGRFVLEDSILEDVLDNTVFLGYPTADSSIQRNIFSRSASIVTSTTGNVRVRIAHNIFYRWALFYDNVAAVINVGTYPSSQTIVTSNFFLSTGRIALRLPPGFTTTGMIATNNYWNTTDEGIVQSMIFDRNDDLGCASYIPYLPVLASPPTELPVVPLPTILTQPTDRTVNVGQQATFTANAVGVGDVFSQWQFNGADLSGETNSSLVLQVTNVAQAGSYSVRFSSFVGTPTNSAIAMLTVRTPPVVILAPSNQIVSPGSIASLNVAASGTPPLSFQWQLNGTNILGANSETLTVTDVSPATAGRYTVVITDGEGATTSVSADLSIMSVALVPVVILGGPIGRAYEIQYVDALGDTNHWISLTNFVTGRNPDYFIDAEGFAIGRRFYRAVLRP